MIWCGADVIIEGIKGTINEVHLNHPETIPPPSICEKLSSVKLILNASKVEDSCFKGSAGDSEIKNLLVMQETWIRSLGWEDPLKKAMAPHYSILDWRIPWTEEPGGLQPMGLQRVGHDQETNTHTYMRAWISLANYTLKSHFYLLTIRIQWCNWYFYIYSFMHHHCILLLFFHILVADSLELSIYRI